jgi:uncharacterized membrane protein
MTEGIGRILYNRRVPAPRHHEVSRIEGFSDAVFAFALTLLVVSLEPLKNVPELLDALRKAGPFAFTFAMVCWIWWQHNQFFRRYGLQDAWTATLNAGLLFVVLIYVYPLRFLTEALVGPLFGVHTVTGEGTAAQARAVMLTYSGGVLLIFSAFLLMHQHAWRQRAALGLTPLEELNLRYSLRAHAISGGLAVLSILLILLPGSLVFGGWIYALMGPLHAWNGTVQGRAQAALAKASAPAKELQRQHERHDKPHH